MKKILLFTSLFALFGVGSAVYAQVVLVPAVNAGPGDLVQVIVGGAPRAGNVYATPAAIAGVPGYTKSVPLTGFALTFGNTERNKLLNPAGALATGTVTMAPNPGDGQMACLFSTQTQTALTLSANTGQTINNAITAMTALTSYCYVYSAPNATWDRAV